jgi:lysophospholipase L1-like esterase
LRLSVLAVAAGSLGPPALAGQACPRSAVTPTPAPHFRAALARDDPAIIVALGSSSTRGWQASSPSRAYPAVLQWRLGELLPRAHVAVINRGVNGEDAAEELARLQADVIAVRPQLVIWQVGANGALRSVDPAVYARLITAGIAILHRDGVDVILMNNQRSPRILAVPEHAAIDRATADAARATDSQVFDRGALMDAWARAGDPYDMFIAPDRLHHNDLGYRCLGEAVAEAIVDGLGHSAASAGTGSSPVGDRIAGQRPAGVAAAP